MDGYWNDLALLGEQMSLLSQQLSRAKGSNDTQEVRRLDAQIATIQAARDKIIMKIAELSVAA